MKYDIWKINKKDRTQDDGAEEFEANGLFINKGQRIGYKKHGASPTFDGPVINLTISETGSILVETAYNQYIIKQLNEEDLCH